MKPSTIIRKLALSKHREKFFHKVGLHEFPMASLAALMIDIYSEGGKTMLKDLHYDGRNERGKLVTMGMATIEKTDQRGTNYKILHRIVLTKKGTAISRDAVEKIEGIMNKIHQSK